MIGFLGLYKKTFHIKKASVFNVAKIKVQEHQEKAKIKD